MDEPFYNKLNDLKVYPSFKNSLNLQAGKYDIEYHMELILRYFIAKHDKIDFSKYKMSMTLLSDFIDQETIKLIEDTLFDIDTEIKIF